MTKSDTEGLFGLPRTDYREVKGHILRFPTGVIGVPVEYKGGGGWQVIVVGGANEACKVGGSNVIVPLEEIDAAERIVVG